MALVLDQEDKRSLYSQGELFSVEVDRALDSSFTLNSGQRKKFAKKKNFVVNYSIHGIVIYAMLSTALCTVCTVQKRSRRVLQLEQVYYNNCGVNFVTDCNPIFKRYHPIIFSSKLAIFRLLDRTH